MCGFGICTAAMCNHAGHPPTESVECRADRVVSLGRRPSRNVLLRGISSVGRVEWVSSSGMSSMTEQLFVSTPYRQSCQATIRDSDRAGIVLDQTICYPNGGGQPGDHGMLTVAECVLPDHRYEKG